MQLTKHAHTRMQQRGISKFVMKLLYTYGREVERGSHQALLYFDKRARQLIRQDIPPKYYARIEPKLNTYAIESADGSVITVGFRYKPVRA